jgi:hypothetical protein
MAAGGNGFEFDGREASWFMNAMIRFSVFMASTKRFSVVP